jgi:RHS repeat-associated protein
MAGDKIDLGTKVWYPETTFSGFDNPKIPEDVFNSLLGTLSGNAAGLSINKASAAELRATGSPLLSGIQSFLDAHPDDPNTDNKPRSYINWMLIDEQFNYVPEGSGFIRVPGFDNDIQTLAMQDIPVPKSGYLFVYLSNETLNRDVFFDNLVVEHRSGVLMEENGYYPFGLIQKGISSRAAGTLQNKDKTFQGQKFDDDLGIDYYSFKWRNHDPQIGRFIEIDPLADEYEYNSTYAFSENKVTSHVELEGLEAVSAELLREAAAAPPQAKVALGIAAGVAIVGELIYDIFTHPTYMAPPVPGGLGIPGYDPIKGTYTPPGSPPAKVNSTSTQQEQPQKQRSASDQKLIDEAKAQKEKENKSQQRNQQRQQQTKDGKEKEGNSNQGTAGSHDSGSQSAADKQKHDKAEARRAREQAAAEKKKEETKKN